MRIEFKISLSGENSLGEKFAKKMKENPKIHMAFIQAFGHSIMTILELKDEDKIIIDGFKAGQIGDIGKPSDAEMKSWKKSISDYFFPKFDDKKS